jgi:hypothetical protein
VYLDDNKPTAAVAGEYISRHYQMMLLKFDFYDFFLSRSNIKHDVVTVKKRVEKSGNKED